MRSYQIVEWDKPLELKEQLTPKPSGAEVLLKVDACGVCHSDLHIRSGYYEMGEGKRTYLAKMGAELPMTLGHEGVGEVVELGPKAGEIEVGDKRIAFPWIGCGRCQTCSNGDENQCNSPKFLGTRVNGGYSDYLLMPNAKYLFEYGNTPTDLAATFACAGITAYGALKKCGPLRADDHLLIIGAGGVGLTALHIARALTEAKLIVADVDEAKRNAAATMGATATINSSEKDTVKQILEASSGGVAAAIDFVGVPTTSRLGIDTLRKTGILVIVGLYGGAMTIPVILFPFKQMTIRGSYVGTLSEMGELMELVRDGKVPPIPLTPRPLHDANQVLDELSRGEIIGRVVLKP